METKLTEHLKSLAEKYERKEFLVGDPSWFMHQVEGDTNRELLAFIASAISYGSRKQFLPKIQKILDASKGNTYEWIVSGIYKDFIPDNDDCFYRLYTNRTFRQFLFALSEMVKEYGSIKGYLIAYTNKGAYGTTRTADKIEALDAIRLITEWFANHQSIGVIPKDTKSSCKRVCMFLRWMVRDNSPVDLGIWSDIIDKKTLIMPMDTHVVQEANHLGLMKNTTTSMASAIRLTKKLSEIFPDDPLKGDFALFGMGIFRTSPLSHTT